MTPEVEVWDVGNGWEVRIPADNLLSAGTFNRSDGARGLLFTVPNADAIEDLLDALSEAAIEIRDATGAEEDEEER